MTSLSMLNISFADLCQSVSINEELMIELVEYGIVTPVTGEQQEEWLFNVTAVSVANKAKRIHQDLVIDWADIPLVLSLLEEIEALKNENHHLRQRLNRFLVDGC
ncbi:MAG: chaperone modulator CbpM [Agitococcus sp.]|nr:chaperone modulator CbpM [Agitococcus sp.]MDO9180541.1 chaperone modulator CbpM [Agitococcus sp.]